MNVKNKSLIFSVIILVIVFIVGSYYYFSKVRPYNQAFNKATQSMTNEDYDKAITLYGEALSYKNDSSIDKMIDLAKRLKKSKETYGIALKQMVSKDYLTAIDSFIKVDKQDTKRYSDSQNSISECKKLYIADNLKNANDNITSKKFDEANNIGANKLKTDIVTIIKKQKDAAAKSLIQAKAKKDAVKILTITQAINILKAIDSNELYTYTPDDNYLSPTIYPNYVDIKNNYYIFSVADSFDGSMCDDNLCVNKKTAAVYVIDPSGIFLTSEQYRMRQQ